MGSQRFSSSSERVRTIEPNSLICKKFTKYKNDQIDTLHIGQRLLFMHNTVVIWSRELGLSCRRNVALPITALQQLKGLKGGRQ
jgi:hypothetical protein